MTRPGRTIRSNADHAPLAMSEPNGRRYRDAHGITRWTGPRPENEPDPYEACLDKQGTTTGYSRHYRAGQVSCLECRGAQVEARRRRNPLRGAA